MKSAFMTCPFRSISGLGCHHRFAEKEERMNGKYDSKCAHPNDETKCPLYKLWLEQLDKQIDNDEEKKNNSLSKKMLGV